MEAPRGGRFVGQLEQVVRDFVAKFDAKDFDGMLGAFTEDVQGVDELSRKWIRSREGLNEYFGMLSGAVTDIRSTVSDIHETIWGDAAIATCWIDQDYRLQGSPVHVSAPMTIVFRNKDGWKVALISAVPLPEE
jgi:ketosteroid isomerase-like protein